MVSIDTLVSPSCLFFWAFFWLLSCSSNEIILIQTKVMSFYSSTQRVYGWVSIIWLTSAVNAAGKTLFCAWTDMFIRTIFVN